MFVQYSYEYSKQFVHAVEEERLWIIVIDSFPF